MSRIVSQSRETPARRVRVLRLKCSARRCDPKAKFVFYSEAAMKAIELGQEEVRLLGHECLGMEQLLLGLIREGTGIAAKVLISMGINLKDARVEVEKIIGRGSTVADSIPYDPDFSLLLRHSREEADNRGQNYVGSGHLLLGLLHDEEGVATGILMNLGADPSNIRAQVIRMVGEVTESVDFCVFAKRPRREYTTNTAEMAEAGKE